ncbi:MAG TPA: endonuclease/exonuclease/phosphatase family protein [Nocardioidaceae bacterium]|nr:endonuclease/exonuclease/phosphatase family protein [Nocardioidaceae bacterium]
MALEGGTAAEVTVMTYNIWYPHHRDEVARVVRELAPDVLVVNETPKAPFIWRWRCRRLVDSWGMRYAAGGRDAGSNLICVSGRVAVVATSVRRLRQPLCKPRRGVVAARLRVAGAELAVVGVHLSLIASSRPGEAAQAVAVATALTGPVVVAGDLNEGPRGRAWQVFRDAGYADAAAQSLPSDQAGDAGEVAGQPGASPSDAAADAAADAGAADAGNAGDPTYPSWRPVERIDALLVRGAEVRGAGVPDLPAGVLAAASDHLPVVAHLALPRRELAGPWRRL